MLSKRHEKVIYENDRGERIEIAYSFPYLLQGFTGADGTDANITSSKGVGQDGMTITSVNLEPRPLQILGKINENDKSVLAKRRTKLLQVFNPKVQGWLQYEYGDVKKRIRCQVESAPFFSKAFNTFEVLNFVIDLIAANPYWQDLTQSRSDIAIWQGSFEFPLEITEEGIEIGFREPSLIVNILNLGDVSCGMKIQFKALATVVNPSLFNVNTREYFKTNKTMEAGEVITVTTNFQNKRVQLNKNGVVSSLTGWDYTSTFLELDPGDNLLRYDADSGIESLEVSIYFTPQYLGV